MSFVGRFELISLDNYEEYLKALGVGKIQRSLAVKAKPTIEITSSDGKFTLKTFTALQNEEVSFILGEEFDDTSSDGRAMKHTVMEDGNKLVHTLCIGAYTATVTQEFAEAELKATSTVDGITAVQVFKRL